MRDALGPDGDVCGEHRGIDSPGDVASDSLTIGELSRKTGVSTRSLRYYEEQNILVPGRTTTGHRRYPVGSEYCVLYVQDLFQAGLTTKIIRELRARIQDSGEREGILLLLNERLLSMKQARDDLNAEIDHLGEIISGVRAD